MPSINLEMMKQLLQEFSEKEALTTEEIGVIEAEILNLEARIESCRNKLKNLNTDKDKLSGMQQRYASGKFSSVNKTIPQINYQPSPPTASESVKSEIESVKSDETPSTATPLKNASSSQIAKSSKSGKHKEVIAAPEIKTESKVDSKSESKSETESSEIESSETESSEDKSQTDENKETGDTIKSLNDALKGLFRK